MDIVYRYWIDAPSRPMYLRDDVCFLIGSIMGLNYNQYDFWGLTTMNADSRSCHLMTRGHSVSTWATSLVFICWDISMTYNLSYYIMWFKCDTIANVVCRIIDIKNLHYSPLESIEVVTVTSLVTFLLTPFTTILGCE